MQAKAYASWAKIRAMGKNRYCLVNGMLAYGVPMFIVMSFFVNKSFEHGYTLENVCLNLGFWLFFGQVFGILTWFINEKRFLKETKNRENL